ncbi:MAG: ATP-binding protein [Treponema sp.]|nr:ATP-binding protein [Treponema sp.]
MYLNIGNGNFKTTLNGEYVDKSQVIAELNGRIDKKSKLLCISRPRRFGKSLLAQMLCAYYDKTCDSHELFAGLKISSDESFEKYLNKYPVIYLDITWFVSTCGNINDVLKYMEKKVSAEIKKEYPETEGDSLPEVIASAATAYGEKFVIIIDEWDAIFREAKNDEKLHKDYIMLLRGLFKSPMTDNMFSLAFMTGIFPIKKYGTQSAMTDFCEYSILSPEEFAPYTGFTEEEVKALCEKHDMDFETAKKWYDGYSFDGGLSIYNPNSIMKCMQTGKYRNFWARTESFDSLRFYISMDFDGIKQDLIQLVGGGTCKVNTISFQNDMWIINSKNDLLTLLIHLGYLSYNSENSTVRIPNNEIKDEFYAALEESSHKDLAKMIKESDYLLECTLEGKEDEVAAAIEAAHDAGTAPLFYNNEQALRSVIKFAYVSAVDDYVQIQELPSGKGYADVVFIPKKTSDKSAMVIELKWNREADAAISQIKQNNYPQLIKDLSGDIVLVGITYDEKTKKHDCKIERISR